MSIYKREPIQHKLPTGWSDYDAVKQQTIGNIKGLQHFDNPLASTQDSTYSCKNVFQDESGNLTVRPAVRHLETFSDTEVLGVYKTTCGTLWHKSYSGVFGIVAPDVNKAVAIGSGNIAVQEFNGLVYIMYTDRSGKLKFIQFDGNDFSDVKPSIIANNAASPIPRLYNLLSDKIKTEFPIDKAKVLTDDDYHERTVFDLELTSAPNTYILKSGDVLVLSKYRCVLIRRGAVFSTIELDIEFDLAAFIDDRSTEGYFYISTASYTTNDTGYTVTHVQYRITMLGTVFKNTWSRDVSSLDKYDPPNVEVYATTDHIVFNESEYVYGSAPSEFSRFSVISNSGVVRIIDKPGYKFVACSNKYIVLANVITEDTVQVLDAPHIYNISGEDDYYNPVIPAASQVTVGEHIYMDAWERTYYDYRRVESDEGSFFVSDIRQKMQFVANPQLTTLSEDSRRFVMNVNNGNREIVSVDNADMLAITFDGSLYVKRTDSGISIVYRQPKILYEESNREVSDAIPLLSEISDEVITSFYLDNIYWFVTKHRIFGTGVADEQFAITYFDPRKYFHFDEELTGAIRISDTSFWAFHANGAYLIYKGSSQLYDELTGEYTEVITWLCTSTAESKGCDFENALVTLPVTSYIASVTSDDISYVTMRENVQTDDRILVPMTLALRQFVANLLNETESVVPVNYRYNTIFCLNPARHSGVVPALVYNAASESWWYWELPFDKVYQAKTTETNIWILAKHGNDYSAYDLFTECFDLVSGGITYHLFADRLNDGLAQIEWHWQSALLYFDSIDYRKQLLFTNFNLDDRQVSSASFDYYFNVYDREHTESQSSDAETIVDRAQCYSCRTHIARFRYLQLNLQHKESADYSGYTKPKFNSISFKYRLLWLAGGTL